MDENLSYDQFYNELCESARKNEVKKLRSLLDSHSKSLIEIEATVHHFPFNELNYDTDPINVDATPYEQASLLNLIKTDNKVLNKIVTVLAALVSEMEILLREGETKYFWGLALYGEGLETNRESGENLLQMGAFMSFLQELSFFVKRCYQVIKMTMCQLSVLYSPSKAPYKIDTNELHLKVVFTSIGNMFRILIGLDSIVEQNTSIREDWNAYKRMIKSIQQNMNQRVDKDSKLYRYEKLMFELESSLLSGLIFQNCIEQNFDEDKSSMVCKNLVLANELFSHLGSVYGEIESILPNDQQVASQTTQQRFVALCALCALYQQVFYNFDKKLFKSIWLVHKRIPIVIFVGTTSWSSNDWMLQSKTLTSLVNQCERNAQQTNKLTRLNYHQSLAQTLSKTLQKYKQLIDLWLVKMHSVGEVKIATAPSIEELFSEGIDYVNYINYTIKSFLNLTLSLERPAAKSNIIELCKLVELVKTVHKVFHEKKPIIIICKTFGMQSANRFLISLIQTAKKRIQADKKYNDTRTDILSGLVLAANSLNGPATRERLLIAQIGLLIANRMRTFRPEENVLDLLHKIETISQLETRIAKACDCDYLYWHFEILLPNYLTDTYENAHSPKQINFMVWSLRDCIGKLSLARHAKCHLLIEKYLKDLIKIINDTFLDRICRDIETDLRLSIHLDIKSDQSKIFKESLKNLSKFLNVEPLIIHDRLIDIKTHVKQYLDKTFYNLTTVALHDWKAYNEMRNLANQKYFLELSESYLPSSTLEQGLDVLEIMRNIHVFVTRYAYNMNNQIFVEKSSHNKHLNTINIRNIANSIRTHGIGIINTTVNFTYQYLKKQFFIFSQFLYDEHIKAKLIKDITFFKESKASLKQKYPYERAEKFIRYIRRLGILQDNQTYLDQFRLLINHIGNAMAYVRMIRSGGLNFCSNSIRFVPDLDDIISFEQYAKELKTSSSQLTETSAKYLDETLANLVKNFSEGTNYFKILVDVFKNEFRSNKNVHLKLFYIILPPLTLNYIEHIIGTKEKLNKKNSQGAGFTDDGFAIGIAYILKLLDQNGDFDSLHWFQSVRDKFQNNKDALTNQQKNEKNDDKLLQTNALTLQRYSTYLREFELLQYALRSAQIFFRDDDELNTIGNTNNNNNNNNGANSTSNVNNSSN